MYKNPDLVLAEPGLIEAGNIVWRSPSNIAIIKYWGKHGRQLPRNPSISFTLNGCFSETMLEYFPKTGAGEGIDLEFFFDGQPNDAFGSKILRFLDSLNDIFPFLRQFHLAIHSTNSFPHSAGIASSASAMSALALALCTLEDRLFGTLQDDAAFEQKASYIARLGSGSAARSVFGTMALWGKTDLVAGSSDEFAIGYGDKINAVFSNYNDTILIASSGEKSVSSRAGHALMEGNIYADSRYREANQRLANVLDALQKGDTEQFGILAEAEALTLHALMMASQPPYILLKTNTLAMIERIQAYRRVQKEPLYFTLDAGPNVHLLYPDSIKTNVEDFIAHELQPLCEDGTIISDWVGDGPMEL